MSAVDTTEQSQEQEPVTEAAAEKTRHQIFRFSDYVHVGDGAEDCAHAEDGGCADDGHFHAWVRLPNPFQIRDISEKARAARARRVRSLNDPESDGYVILEAELDTLRADEALKGIVVDELLERDFRQDYDEAIREVMDLEDETAEVKDDEDPPKLYANIVQDQEEYARQLRLPEDERDEDFPELVKTVESYSEAVNKAMEAVQEPKRKALLERDMKFLVGEVRRKRVTDSGAEAYLHTFNTWQWFVCTYRPKAKGTPTERVYKDFNQFKYEAPSDVVQALQAAFSDLEVAMADNRGGGPRGNS